jgi:hypothetical protein
MFKILYYENRSLKTHMFVFVSTYIINRAHKSIAA